MSAIIIDGKANAQKIKNEVAIEVKEFEKARGRKPTLAVALIGNNSASEVYVKNKEMACSEVGINSVTHKLGNNASKEESLALIDNLNNDKDIDGILVQLPLPSHLNELEITNAVLPSKDVDGFTMLNAGKLSAGSDCLLPCTPSGCIELVKSTNQSIEGKHAVIVGRSNIVGKPLAQMLLKENATVTICHSRTKNLSDITRQADILIAAIGKKEFITGDMIKFGAIVIDVGINRFEGKLYGDVEFETAKKVAAYITPVPGGVGPMTIAMLLKNTIKSASGVLSSSLLPDGVLSPA